MSQETTRSLTGDLLALMDVRPSEDDLAAASLHLLDWLGCALGGTTEPTGHAMAMASGCIASEATHPLSPLGRSAPEVAWALGSFGSLLEMDDVHRKAILHPGPVVMPAVLACTTLASAHRAAEAVLRGYEAMIRLGCAVGQGHYAQFHNTATCGGLGSAVAASWMLGLDVKQTQWAMAHALSVSGGLWECRNEPGATKHLHVAEAARRGVQAALAAEAGLAGPLRILEGAQGFFVGLAPDGKPEAILEGSLWAIHNTSFKPWPACRHTHPAIDAALALRADLAAPELKGRMPDKIVIETYRDAVLFCDKPTPTDTAAARFSLQHAVAVALYDGPPTLGAFASEALDLPRYAELRGRVRVLQDASLTADYPAHYGARVSVQIGKTILTQTIGDAWGDSENPMDAAAVVAKFDSLASWAGVTQMQAASLKDAALDAAQGGGAGKLVQLMAALTPTARTITEELIK
ncbi:MAG: 2-methylcitrate dehydratase PrpD [Glaciecola sp.]|jgi:2-methylcitrate dehydratase PrpD